MHEIALQPRKLTVEMPPVERMPKDFASRLMGIACTEDAIAHSTTFSAHSLERQHGRTSYRSGESGPRDSGLIGKWRAGKHVPSPTSLQELAEQCPSLFQISPSTLWAILRHGLPTALTVREVEMMLDDGVFWAIHSSLPLISHMRGPAFLVKPNDARMHSVVMQGSFDAVAALVMMTRNCELDNDVKDALYVASHIPPTLALYMRNPASKRVAYLVFARLRQLMLDDLQAEKKQLRLYDYDLESAASAAPHVLPLAPEPANPYKKSYRKPTMPPVPDDVANWIRHHRATIVRLHRSADGPRWKTGLGPAQACDEMAKEGHALHSSAIAQFQKTLGTYWS